MRPSAAFYLFRTLLLLIVLGLVGMGVFAKRGWLDLRRINQQNAVLEARIEGARRQNERDVRQIEAMQTRPAAQERVIRQMLGYVRPDETVIEFQ